MEMIKLLLSFLENTLGYTIIRVNKTKTKTKTKQKSYREQLIDFIEEHSNLIKGDVLDIGSGMWTWPKDRFKNQCNIKTFDQFNYDNIDIDIIGDILNLSDYVESDYYDAILCLDVFEHVKNPFTTIKEIHKVLKKNGVFIASTPFLKNLHGEEYGDYWRITRQGWNELLKNFKDVQISWGGDEILPKYYIIIAIK